MHGRVNNQNISMVSKNLPMGTKIVIQVTYWYLVGSQGVGSNFVHPSQYMGQFLPRYENVCMVYIQTHMVSKTKISSTTHIMLVLMFVKVLYEHIGIKKRCYQCNTLHQIFANIQESSRLCHFQYTICGIKYHVHYF